MGWQAKTQSNLFFSFGLLPALKQWILNNGKTLFANTDKEEKEQIQPKIKRYSGFPFYVNFCVRFFFSFFYCFCKHFSGQERRCYFCISWFFKHHSTRFMWVRHFKDKKYKSYVKASFHFYLNTFSQKIVFKYQDNISALQHLATMLSLLS